MTILCPVCYQSKFLNAMRKGRRWGIYFVYKCRFCKNHHLVDYREVKKDKNKD